MKKYLPPLFLFLSFGVKGQVKLNDGTTVKTTFIGSNATRVYVDTPQADRNPNDFYDSIPSIISKVIIDSFSYDDRGVVYKHGKPYGIKAKQLSLEEKLLMYASECWNDSSKYCYYISSLWNNEEVEISCDCSHYNNTAYDSTNFYYIGYRKCTHMKYIHREPTFKGFLEYLKKK